MKLNRMLLCGGFLLGGALQCAVATPLTGNSTFNMSGIITVTPTTITWTDLSSVSQMFVLTGGSNPQLVAEAGENAVENLVISSEPVGSTISPSVPFILFTEPPDSLPSLNLTFIFPGTAAGCPLGAPVVGQQCTPPNPGGSPFTFTNDPGGTSDAKFVFSGVTSDGLDTWTGIFTSQFSTPYQTVLAGFPGSPVSQSYSATVYIQAIPEPASFLLSGLGLAALLGYRKYRRN